jgi:hypothetical protein
MAFRLLPFASSVTHQRVAAEGSTMQESQHPKGALLFMLIYLVTLTALWLNAYLRLWGE